MCIPVHYQFYVVGFCQGPLSLNNKTCHKNHKCVDIHSPLGMSVDSFNGVVMTEVRIYKDEFEPRIMF